MNNSITERMIKMKQNIEKLQSHIKETILRQQIQDETVDTESDSDSMRELLNTYYTYLQLCEARMAHLIHLIEKTNHCCHEIITDYIDIDPDKSMTIKYCSKCSLTFE